MYLVENFCIMLWCRACQSKAMRMLDFFVKCHLKLNGWVVTHFPRKFYFNHELISTSMSWTAINIEWSSRFRQWVYLCYVVHIYWIQSINSQVFSSKIAHTPVILMSSYCTELITATLNLHLTILLEVIKWCGLNKTSYVMKALMRTIFAGLAVTSDSTLFCITGELCFQVIISKWTLRHFFLAHWHN